MALRGYVIAGALLAYVLVGLQGYRSGWNASEDARNLELLKVSQEVRAKELARLELQAERDALALQLEDAANADPISAPQCLSAARVRRLQLR